MSRIYLSRNRIIIEFGLLQYVPQRSPRIFFYNPSQFNIINSKYRRTIFNKSCNNNRKSYVTIDDKNNGSIIIFVVDFSNRKTSNAKSAVLGFQIHANQSFNFYLTNLVASSRIPSWRSFDLFVFYIIKSSKV